MKLIKFFYMKCGHFLFLFIFLFLLLWFQSLEKGIVPIYFMYNKIDSYIPFIKEFIIPYYLWYIYIFWGFIYLGFVSKIDFYRLFAFLFLGMSISYTIYMLFPNAQSLRPNITENDIFSRLIKGLYAFDTPTNVCPSIHVINTLGVHIAITNCYTVKDKPLWKLSSLIITVLICSSTVFLKQHSILDVLAGLLLSVILYLLIYQLPKLYTEKLPLYNEKSI